MNLFVFDSDPVVCAQGLDDRRLNKLFLESAQIIAAARKLRGLSSPYGASHIHHPVIVWAASRHRNMVWVAHLFKHLYLEWRLRGGKSHKTWQVMGKTVMRYTAFPCPKLSSRDFQNSAKNAKLNLDYSTMRDTTLAYRRYITARWVLEMGGSKPYKPVFTNRRPPIWIPSNLHSLFNLK